MNNTVSFFAIQCSYHSCLTLCIFIDYTAGLPTSMFRGSKCSLCKAPFHSKDSQDASLINQSSQYICTSVNICKFFHHFLRNSPNFIFHVIINCILCTLHFFFQNQNNYEQLNLVRGYRQYETDSVIQKEWEN